MKKKLESLNKRKILFTNKKNQCVHGSPHPLKMIVYLKHEIIYSIIIIDMNENVKKNMIMFKNIKCQH